MSLNREVLSVLGLGIFILRFWLCLDLGICWILIGEVWRWLANKLLIIVRFYFELLCVREIVIFCH